MSRINEETLSITVLFFALATAAGVAWVVWKQPPSSEATSIPAANLNARGNQVETRWETPKAEPQPADPTPETATIDPYSGMGNPDSESFPPPSTEVINGRTERTIHMGVRQYVWEPNVITAKRGELVRLIIHNADVEHGLVIPDLGVEQSIPPEGAVVEFLATQAGTFEFFCSAWCGEGHMEMLGQVVIQ